MHRIVLECFVEYELYFRIFSEGGGSNVSSYRVILRSWGVSDDMLAGVLVGSIGGQVMCDCRHTGLVSRLFVGRCGNHALYDCSLSDCWWCVTPSPHGYIRPSRFRV